MFKSISYIAGSIEYGYLPKFKIIDDDFEALRNAPDEFGAGSIAIIDCYEIRGLNVAANFILYLQFIKKMYGDSINNILPIFKQKAPTILPVWWGMNVSKAVKAVDFPHIFLKLLSSLRRR